MLFPPAPCFTKLTSTPVETSATPGGVSVVVISGLGVVVVVSVTGILFGLPPVASAGGWFAGVFPVPCPWPCPCPWPWPWPALPVWAVFGFAVVLRLPPLSSITKGSRPPGAALVPSCAALVGVSASLPTSAPPSPRPCLPLLGASPLSKGESVPLAVKSGRWSLLAFASLKRLGWSWPGAFSVVVGASARASVCGGALSCCITVISLRFCKEADCCPGFTFAFSSPAMAHLQNTDLGSKTASWRECNAEKDKNDP